MESDAAVPRNLFVAGMNKIKSFQYTAFCQAPLFSLILFFDIRVSVSGSA